MTKIEQANIVLAKWGWTLDESVNWVELDLRYVKFSEGSGHEETIWVVDTATGSSCHSGTGLADCFSEWQGGNDEDDYDNEDEDGDEDLTVLEQAFRTALDKAVRAGNHDVACRYTMAANGWDWSACLSAEAHVYAATSTNPKTVWMGVEDPSGNCWEVVVDLKDGIYWHRDGGDTVSIGKMERGGK